MATPSPQGFVVFSHSPPGRTERMQVPARLLMSPSGCTSSITCPFRVSSCFVPNSQHCFSSLRTKALDSSSAPFGVSEFSSFEGHSSIILERSLRKDGKTSSMKNIENQRSTAIRAGHGEPLGNNNVQFTSESGFQDDTLTKNHVPLYVMLPLDTVTMHHTLKRAKALQVGLRALKLIGVDGVMIHIWWGVVQGAGPKSYNWSAYLALLELIKSAGLKVQASMCFHGCSKLAGSCTVSLPPWILAIGNLNPDVFYTDKVGGRFVDCLSLAVDSLPVFGDRSPIQMYREFLESFRDTFSHYLGDTIVEVVMGLGPDGELRYPAFPEENAQRRIPGMGEFQCYDKDMLEGPGVGEFQCYDKYMLESLRNYAEAHGKSEWGQVPNDTPSYVQWPNDAGFFHEQYGSWKSPFGQLFLSWYSGELLAHGHHMLSLASSVFQKYQVLVMGKVPGVHWWYKTKSHAAELTAGYYNVDGRDGYDEVALMFTENAAMMVLPCMEMSDKEQPSEAKCSPELLLLQIRKACSRHGVLVAGQNSLPRFDLVAYARMKNSIHRFDYPYIPRLAVFTFLQMGKSLFYAEHWRLFVNFVRNINKDAWGGSSGGGPPGGGQDLSFWAAISTVISFVLKCNINGILSLSSAVLNSKKKLESMSRMQPAGLQVCCA